MADKPLNETIVIETNFGKSNITTRREIKWEEINFPENWVLDKATTSQQYIDNNPLEILQSKEGTVQIQFEQPRNTFFIPRSLSSRSLSSHQHISPLEYIVRSPSRASTSRVRETFPTTETFNRLRINPNNIVTGVQDLSAKMDKIISCFKEKNMPTKQTSLQEKIATPSIQLPPEVTDFKLKSKDSLVATLNETMNALKNLKIRTLTEFSEENYQEEVKNQISKLSNQLKGWWDNYLSQPDKDKILNSVKQEEGASSSNTESNAVYTLIVNIIEHFTGRWSEDSENIRTLLQNLRCKTLTSFRWYKDTFLCRVMELLEANSSHWKSKFIDGLPHLFAERIRTN
ncbi:hypothetical protein L1987_30473 [Smallanthus sonchifolius]|uniref:Uncharacterized protein n=1 Tax=Smallanthus sonchifolius TaxID=185202 RepID=A0ACB9I2P4_9ASTR|nr:hypothetical protein L1987_30473 [Smallanthus sonchifolius]